MTPLDHMITLFYIFTLFSLFRGGASRGAINAHRCAQAHPQKKNNSLACFTIFIHLHAILIVLYTLLYVSFIMKPTGILAPPCWSRRASKGDVETDRDKLHQ